MFTGSSTFHMTFVQIVEFDWLSGGGGAKRVDFHKCLKIFFSETIKGKKPKLGIHA